MLIQHYFPNIIIAETLIYYIFYFFKMFEICIHMSMLFETFFEDLTKSLCIQKNFNALQPVVRISCQCILIIQIELNMKSTYIFDVLKNMLSMKSRNAVAFRPAQKKLIKRYRNRRNATSVYYADRASSTFRLSVFQP